MLVCAYDYGYVYLCLHLITLAPKLLLQSLQLDVTILTNNCITAGSQERAQKRLRKRQGVHYRPTFLRLLAQQQALLPLGMYAGPGHVQRPRLRPSRLLSAQWCRQASYKR
eukprot:1160736-Pelagomonas_calceolata.AAC.13